MILNLFLVFCVVFFVGAAPPVPASDKEQATVIPIVKQTDEFEPNGTYHFSYETGNGIKREEIAYDKTLPAIEGRSSGGDDKNADNDDNEIHVQRGSWSYTAPDGTEIKVSYIADENGFQPVGDHIPRVPETDNTGKKEQSGRSLKISDQSEAGSAPAAVASPVAVALSSRIKEPEVSTTEAAKSSDAPSEGSTTRATESEATTKENESTTKADAKENESTTKADAKENESTTKSDEISTKANEITTQASDVTTKEAESTTKSLDASTTAAAESSTQPASSTENISTTTIA